MNFRDCLANKGVDIAKLLLPNFEQMATHVTETISEDADLCQATLYIQEQYGRFGNNIYQILHAVIIARYIGIGFIECKFYFRKRHAESYIFDNIVMYFGIDETSGPPEIRATLFYPYGFEICFNSLNYYNVKKDAERLGRLFFNQHIDSLPSNKKTVAFHFRAGDIFSENGAVHPLYVQPPLSYYVLALDHICETTSDFEVYVVFEDNRNPVIKKFINILEGRGIPHILQSSSLEDDAYSIATAHCIVSSFSTFCEALALMSENIRRWYAFRTVTAHGDEMQPFVPNKFREIMHSDGVEIFVIEDRLGQYIAPKTWNSSVDQIDTMQSYPVSSLEVRKIPDVRRSM